MRDRSKPHGETQLCVTQWPRNAKPQLAYSNVLDMEGNNQTDI